MKNLLMNLYLMWGTMEDLKEKKISLTYLKIGAILGILFFIREMKNQDLSVINVFLSFLPGMIFLLIAKITKEKIGYGDGWLFLIISCWMGTMKTWALWQTSLLLSSVFSIVMLITQKCKMKSHIAFVPFVWLAHLLLWSLNYGK